MQHARLKTAAAFLIFSFICFWLSGPSFGADDDKTRAAQESGQGETTATTCAPLEIDRHPLAGLDLDSPGKPFKRFWAI